MSQAKKQTTKTKPAAQAKTAPKAKSAREPKRDELDAMDDLNLHLRQAKGIIGVAHGSRAGSNDGLADGDMTATLAAAYDKLEAAEEAAWRLNRFRTARNKAGAVS